MWILDFINFNFNFNFIILLYLFLYNIEIYHEKYRNIFKIFLNE